MASPIILANTFASKCSDKFPVVDTLQKYVSYGFAKKNNKKILTVTNSQCLSSMW